MPLDRALDRFRRFAVARTFVDPASLADAIQSLGFVQADPIRAPARAQDLTLRHRVDGYRAGELERRYASLDVEEDVFINYGFLPRDVHALMHPRAPERTAVAGKRARALVDFVRERGEVHPRDVQAHFSHGTVTNYWGGTSNATTHLMDLLHYRGVLRVARRSGGIRIYAVQPPLDPPANVRARRDRIDRLVDIVVGKYAPVPSATLSMLVARLRYAVPQWRGELKAALQRARRRLAHAHAGDATWYWPAEEHLDDADVPEMVRLLAPFDPLVWDRRRFTMLWEWDYRFEAYTPEPKRRLGYYALPLLWRDGIVGWANVAVTEGVLDPEIRYVRSRRPAGPAFARALEAELARLAAFLDLPSAR